MNRRVSSEDSKGNPKHEESGGWLAGREIWDLSTCLYCGGGCVRLAESDITKYLSHRTVFRGTVPCFPYHLLCVGEHQLMGAFWSARNLHFTL